MVSVEAVGLACLLAAAWLVPYERYYICTTIAFVISARYRSFEHVVTLETLQSTNSAEVYDNIKLVYAWSM